jgi:hypothetical protein
MNEALKERNPANPTTIAPLQGLVSYWPFTQAGAAL